jgi:hypothetical protein
MAAHIEAQLRAFARKVARPGNAPAQLTRAPKMSMHQVTVGTVDTGTGTVQVQFNGAADTTGGVRYIQAYTATNPPQAGDIAWGHHNGTDFTVVGRHIVPNSTVILP